MTQNKLWEMLRRQEIDEPSFRELSAWLQEQERLRSRSFPTTYGDANAAKPNTKGNLVFDKSRSKIRF